MSESNTIQTMAPVVPITTTFCFRYLSESKSIKPETIVSLVNHGFDSIYTLMAVDVDKDLVRLSDISLGQRCLLRIIIADLIRRVGEAKGANKRAIKRRSELDDIVHQVILRVMASDLIDTSVPITTAQDLSDSTNNFQ
ncbi:unnamed protein product [Oppiella nova]|uniref:Uncharacterized protein n=1 Tax=Oppiella nova TaxID=334625 RepID=A0A7R9MK52_9ACAR|nr:unnamed protein product [Oppiella nova]CAG2177693.1 unnamed protein product [Oppiella nova]